jgi:hypothetical protein
MKMRKLLFVIKTMVVLASLIGCMSTNQVKIPSVTVTATIGDLPPNVSPTSTQMYTPTPLPTLSADEGYARLRTLLGNNTDCKLPCWMGIIPGQSTWQDINEQLTMFSSIAKKLYIETGANTWSTGDLTILYPNDNMAVEVSPYYLTATDQKTIAVISIETRSYAIENGEFAGDVYGYATYNKLFKAYTVSGVLSSFGVPDQIYVGASLRGDLLITPGFGDYFEIYLWYPNQGIFMTYKMQVEGSGNNYRFCPPNAFILGDLTTSGLGAGYQEVLLKLGDRYQGFFPPSKYLKTTEDAIGMTSDEFYELFRSPTDRCLETPKAIWRPK